MKKEEKYDIKSVRSYEKSDTEECKLSNIYNLTIHIRLNMPFWRVAAINIEKVRLTKRHKNLNFPIKLPINPGAVVTSLM